MGETTSSRGSPAPPPRPPSDPAATRPHEPLRRSRDDRVIAGVAGGLGRYFGIDPVIFRIAFVLTALFGGAGLLAYLVGWLTITKEPSSALPPTSRSGGGDERRSRNAVAVILLALGVVLVAPSISLWGGRDLGEGLFLPILVLAAGVALLVWPDHEAAADLAPGTAPSTAATEIGLDSGPAQRPFIGPLTVAALMMLTGGAVLLDRIDVLEVTPGTFLALCLVLIGVALLVSAFVGRARGLIVLGAVLAPFAWFFAAVDITWWDGVGERIVVIDGPRDLAALGGEIHHGIGSLRVDLADADLGGRDLNLAVGLSIGELVVVVPPDIEVVIDADGGVGELVVQRPGPDLTDSGVDLELSTVLRNGDAGRLHLELELGMGEGRVEVAR